VKFDEGFVTEQQIPGVIAGLGAGLLLVIALEGAVIAVMDVSPPEGYVGGLIIGVVTGVSLVYGSYWLSKSDLSAARYGRVGAWALMALLLCASVVTGFALVAYSANPFAVFVATRWGVGSGAFLGLVLGLFEARAFESARESMELRREKDRVAGERDRLEEFASIVSHDLRGPLNVAAGNLELVGEECDSPHLGTVERAHDRMEAIIDETLTLARQGKAVDEKESVELERVANTCWETVKTANATLDVDASATLSADRDRLRHVFENLYRNALDHGPDDVTVRVGPLDDGFFIEDDGPGIPEDDAETIFEPGFTTSEEGSGFGLAIVRRIVEAHGWSVAVTEGQRGGARFEFSDVQEV